jgi:hypothetical protein
MGEESAAGDQAKKFAEESRVAELGERIEILKGLGDRELGSFLLLDWIACIFIGVILPLILLYWGAP